MRFDSKIVVITGAASGMGRAAARRFAEEGAHVVLADVDSEVEQVAGELPEGTADAVIADASTEDGAEKIAEAARKAGGADILINNAGTVVTGTIEELKAADWKKQIDVNLTGYFLVTKAIYPQLKAKKKGAIVNTCSVSGIGGDWAMLAYNASKGGVSLFTKALAMDAAADGIRVNEVNPSITDTKIGEDVVNDSEKLAKFRERLPLGAPIESEDVAAAMAFLASDDARMITGVSLPVDGGALASNGQPRQA